MELARRRTELKVLVVVVGFLEGMWVLSVLLVQVLVLVLLVLALVSPRSGIGKTIGEMKIGN